MGFRFSGIVKRASLVANRAASKAVDIQKGYLAV
ncbi:auxin-induced protein, partial [Trifolium medium]|nr:auxin-induced protein [Trifolium medium]